MPKRGLPSQVIVGFVLLVILGLGGLVICGVLAFRSLGLGELAFPEEEFAELEGRYGAKIEEVRSRAEADLQRQRDELAAARTAVPDDAPIAPDWELRECLRRAWLPVEEETLMVLSWDYLGGLGAAGSLSEDTLSELGEKLGVARKAGKITELEARLDASVHPSEVVQEAFEQYVLSATFLDEIEAALDLGLCRDLDDAEHPDDENWDFVNRRGFAGDLLACRVVALAKRGDGVAAGASLARLCRYQVLVGHDSLANPQFWSLHAGWRRIGDVLRPALFLLKQGPLDGSLRQQIVDYVRQEADGEICAERLRVIAVSSPETGVFLDFIEEDERFRALNACRTYAATEEFGALLDERYCDVVDRIEELKRKYTPDLLEEDGDEQRSLFRDLVEPFKLGVNLARGNDQVSMMLICGQLADAVLWHASDTRMADVVPVAFALGEYKNAWGEYPESLEELMPKGIEAVPVDPFSGQPIGYRRVEEGYELTAASARRAGGDSVAETATLWRMAD